MPSFALMIAAEAEGIAEIRRNANPFLVRVTCSRCGYETPNWVTLDPDVEQESQRGRGKFNLVMKCKDCGREMFFTITSCQNAADVTVAAPTRMLDVDARGGAISAWALNGCVFASPSGQAFAFDGEDLTEFGDYDDVADAPMLLTDVAFSVE